MSKRNQTSNTARQTQDARSTQARSPQGEDEDADKKENTLAHIPLAEWVVAGIGLLLVIGVLGFMGVQVVAGDTSPPNISIQAGATQESQNGYLIALAVMNSGGQTAGGVIIEGELMEGDEAVETSQATLTYVPAHSQRSGGLFFSKDPRQYELRLRALGYETP